VPILRAVLINAPLVNFAFNGVIFTITLALRQQGTSTAVIGLVQAAIMVGGLLGAVVAPRLQGRLQLGTATTVITLTGALLFCAAALLIPSPLVALPVGMNLILAPTVNAALFAVLLRSTPEEMRGRVSNTVVMVATALATLAPLTAGLLVEHVSGAWAIGAFAAIMAIAAVLSLILPGLHQVASPASAPVGPGHRGAGQPEVVSAIIDSVPALITAEDALSVLAMLRKADVGVWIAGGWGIDALLGEQTREHRDLDLLHRANEEPAVVAALADAGFAETLDWRPVRFVVTDAVGREIDLHPLTFAADGSAVQASTDPAHPFVYPASCFVSGTIAGVTVPCLSPEQQVYFHQGYEPAEHDRRDMARLRQAFGIATHF
jgi:lincosamide nucleotidyltransferase A/C/D/E